MGLNKKYYNTTDINPEDWFKRHVYHRDYFAHYLRWTYILKEAKIGESICDFGCGSGNLLEVLWRNKFKQEKYIGLDIREKTIEKARQKYANLQWAQFDSVDLCKSEYDYKSIKADKVCSFEVLEHIGKQNVDLFLNNFKSCGKKNATYYISTPNYDEKVGAAANHIYDSNDGRGEAVQEFSHIELQDVLSNHFNIAKKFGTFASIKDYKHLMNDWQRKMFNSIREYYDLNLVSNIMAPFFPEQSRNTLWVLKRKDSPQSDTSNQINLL